MTRFIRFLLLLFAFGAFVGHDYPYVAIWLAVYITTRVYPIVRQTFDV